VSRVVAARLALIVILVLAPSFVLGADRTDVVVLKNGDRITGEVKNLSGGRLELKTDKAGTIEVKWDAVAQLTSTRFFEVILDDSHRVYGALLLPTSEGTLRVGNEGEAVDAPFLRIAQIDRLRRTFWSRIDGDVGLGLSYAQADSKTEWNVDAGTSYRTPKKKVSLSLDSTFRRSASDDFDREDFTGAFQRFWSGRWSTVGFASWQRNSELALDRRFLGGAGAGLHLWRTVEHDLSVSAGLDVSSERFSDGRAPSDSLEALVGMDYALSALGGRERTLTAGFTVFPSLSLKGRVRFEAKLSARRELFRNFFFNLQFFDSFDNRAADSEATKNDLGVTTSLGWSF
jgi:hypothetical protein